jgi:SAM-dependent methyltransferase
VAELWETAFGKMQTMWGLEPTEAARMAAQRFAGARVKEVLIPGVGYGRNAKAFLERGMSVTGIEISQTAIALARSELGLTIPIHHGSVTEMPFDDKVYDGIFCHGLIYLLDADGRAKLLRDCARQLAPSGEMIFTAISKEAPMYGQGACLGEDWYERVPGMGMYFYDARSIEREFGPHGLVERVEVGEPTHPGGASLPFFWVVCRKP